MSLFFTGFVPGTNWVCPWDKSGENWDKPDKKVYVYVPFSCLNEGSGVHKTEWFPKGGFGGCSWTQKPEQGYKKPAVPKTGTSVQKRTDGTKKRNEGTFPKPPFYKPPSPCPSFPLFFLFKRKETPKKRNDFYPYRTPKILLREGQNAQKSKEYYRKGKKEIPPKQGTEGQGLFPLERCLEHVLLRTCIRT